MIIDEHIIYSYLEGKLSPEENLLVENWEQENAENQELFKTVASIFFARQEQAEVNPVEAFNKIEKRIKLKPIKKSKNMWSYWAIAASLLLFSSIGIYKLFQSNEILGNPTILCSEDTRNFKVCLPDNSIVYLNSYSKLCIPSDFSATNRQIFLEGEAFFDVHSDKANPFIVQTPNKLDIQVYGTKFNLQAYPNDSLVSAKLYSGSIKVKMDSDGMELIELKPQEQITYNHLKNEIQKNNFTENEEELGWRKNKMLFKNANINEFVRTVSSFYQVSIDAKDIMNMNTSINGEFIDKDIITVLEYIKVTSNIDYVISKTSGFTNVHLFQTK